MGQLLDAIAPFGGDGNWPYPDLVQTSGPGQPSITFEGPTINSIPMPGQWLLSVVRKFGWQEQQANFMTGAFLVPKGDPLVHFSYEIRFWESGAMGIFRQLLQTLLKKPVLAVPGGFIPVSAALGIDDRVLKDLGVTTCVIESIEYPKNPLLSSGGKGAWIGKIGFIQYRSPVAALPVPDQTIPDPGAVTPAAANSLAAAQASAAAGAAALQAEAAQALVPPR
jgi:hypothetical protein